MILAKGGIALAGVILASLIALPIMANYYVDTEGTSSATAEEHKDRVVQQWRWMSLFVIGLIIVWIIWSASRHDVREESTDWLS